MTTVDDATTAAPAALPAIEEPSPVAAPPAYRVLRTSDLEALRTERVGELEAEHFRTLMTIAECPPGVDPLPLYHRLGDIQRRIAVHCDPFPNPGAAATADNPADSAASNEKVTDSGVGAG